MRCVIELSCLGSIGGVLGVSICYVVRFLGAFFVRFLLSFIRFFYSIVRVTSAVFGLVATVEGLVYAVRWHLDTKCGTTYS